MRALLVWTVVASCLTVCSSGHAALIVGYSGTDPSVAQSGAGVTNSGISRGPGVTVAGGGNYATSGWSNTAAPVSNEYVEWGWSSSPSLDLDDLQIQYKRTGSGPDDLQIQVSINGGGYTTIFTDTAVSTQDEFHNISLAAFNNVTSATFRLFGYQANNASGQLDLTNYATGLALSVNGVAHVPEPGSMAAFGVGALAACYAGWRRRKATRRQNS